MKKKNLLHIVYCIDTEGPMTESISATFKRLRQIYKVNLPASKKNLIKLQNKKIKLNGLEHEISESFSKKLLSYNDNWNKINQMLKIITSKKFRNNFKDSFGKGLRYNWFIMDHVGFKDNPRKRDLGFSKIWNKYMSHYKTNNKKKVDGFHFHHHPIPFSKSANHCATHFFNKNPIIYDILNRRIIDHAWFPSVFRAGFHAIRPDSHWFLEQFIPFDYSNQSVTDEKDNFIDFKKGRLGDWRRSPKNWKPYHPDHDDYQKKGNCRRWSARCLNIGTRGRLLSNKDILQAFKEASKGKSAIMSFTNHDYRDMQQDIIEVFKKIKLISQKYPNVKFKWSEAREAMRESLKLKNYKKSGISQKILGNILHIKFNEPIFGPQPYLAIKTKSGEYFHDNLDIQKPFFEWSYTFDDQTIPLNNIETIGWAANDKFGRTYVSRYNSKTKKFKKKII
jgi:hypothetical protein